MSIGDHPNHPTGDWLGYVMWASFGAAVTFPIWGPVVAALLGFVGGASWEYR